MSDLELIVQAAKLGAAGSDNCKQVAAAIERFTSECKKLHEELAELITCLRITKDELQRVRNSGPADL